MLDKTVATIGKSLILLWIFCVLFQWTFQDYFHSYLLVSASWLLASIILIYLLNFFMLEASNLKFKWTVFCTCLIWGLILIYISSVTLDLFRGLPFVGLDDVTYNKQQIEIAMRLNRAKEINPNLLMTGFYSGYPNFGGVLMYLFGSTHWAVPRIVTVLLFAASTLIFYSIMKKCYSIGASRLATLIYGFSPMFIFFAIFQLKDSFIILFLLTSILAVLNIIERRKSILNILILLLSLAFLIPIRAMAIVSFLLAVATFIILFKGKNIKFSLILRISLAIVGVLWLWNYIASFGIITDPSVYFDIRFDSLGDSGIMAGKNSMLTKTGLATLISAPLFIIMSPFVPIPTALMFENPLYPNLNSDFSGNLFLYTLIPFFVVSMVSWYKNREKYKYIPFFILLFGIYKVGAALSGMTLWSFRQTLPATLALLMIIPISFENPEEKTGRFTAIILLYVLIFAWATFRYFIRL